MKHIKIDEMSMVFIIGSLLMCLVMQNGFYVFLPLFTFFVLIYFVQQPYKPGVFSLIILQHYLQIAAGVWLCNYIDQDINYNTPSRSTAVTACCIGLTFLVAPIVYVQSKIPKQTFESLKDSVSRFSSQKVMYAYIISFFVASGLGSIAFVFGGLTQVIISFVKVKWILFLLFGYQSILKNENKTIFLVFIALEFVSGFLGFFSEFKTVLYFLIILGVGLIEKLTFKQVFSFLILGVALGFFALAWSGIKSDYRSFLNGGQRSQTVVVEKDEAIDKLIDLSKGVSSESLNNSVVGFLDRLQYTYHFAKTIDRVPEVLPFEYGKNWLASLEFTTTPRLLNPDKPNYEATVKTKKYTGIKYAGAKEGVSFSLGYFPDSYIDFGLYGMMFVLLALGSVYALVYSYLMKNASRNMVFNYATVGAFFMELNALEMDSTYLLGRFFASIVTFVVLVKFFFPYFIRILSAPTLQEMRKKAIVSPDRTEI